MKTDDAVEWLEPDGLGGFASGSSSLVRSRRYHGLLLVAATPPTGRLMLVNGLEAWVETGSGTYAISAQGYLPDVVHPDGQRHLIGFINDPWPLWTFRLPDGIEIEQELFVPRGIPLVALSWRLRGSRSAARLIVRPLLSGRDYHSTHHENGAFRFGGLVDGGRVTWSPYDGIPAISAVTNGRYEPRPEWYRNFLYHEEQTRGLDSVEDLASPGVFTWNLRDRAALMLTTEPDAACMRSTPVSEAFDAIRGRERARRSFPSPLHRAADGYLVRRGPGQTIVAGYPWFTDWGRDTFISIRGLCIAAGRLDAARDILLAWAGAVSEGMLPNRFPDRGDAPEFNSVDASLWFVIAAGDFLAACENTAFMLPHADVEALQGAVDGILEGYARGTRFGIRLESDGLLACGEPGTQLTWMDAKVGDHVITPRVGKPVEVQALWLNALSIAGRWTGRWTSALARGAAAFRARFWNDSDGCLFDVVDVDHQAGEVDPSFRPNQILAVGGLPLNLLPMERARRVVEAVEARLVTPMGLRSLAPGSAGYASAYEGSPAERDARYHQGTVWPWLVGPFVEAWLRVNGFSPRSRREARRRFLDSLLQLAQRSGGHLPEIADAEPPHTPRGCPAQAWSVGELLRLDLVVLAPRRRRPAPTRPAPAATVSV